RLGLLTHSPLEPTPFPRYSLPQLVLRTRRGFGYELPAWTADLCNCYRPRRRGQLAGLARPHGRRPLWRKGPPDHVEHHEKCALEGETPRRRQLDACRLGGARLRYPGFAVDPQAPVGGRPRGRHQTLPDVFPSGGRAATLGEIRHLQGKG